MKIAFIISQAVLAYSGGVPVQGRMWKEGLEQCGDTVDLINVWDKWDWDNYDLIIFLGRGGILEEYVNLLKPYKRPKLVSAPIIDWSRSLLEYKLKCRFLGNDRLHIHSSCYDYYKLRKKFDFFLARSEFEKSFIVEGVGVSPEKVRVVPLSMRFSDDGNPIDLTKKEEFCLHVSRLAFSGKNVARIVEAAKKYKFNLKLAGSVFGEDERIWLNNLIKDAPNIEYTGYLSDEELKSLYKRAKVFALPSIVEGVGFVALEAAVYGAEIVLTDIGAPKEYYDGRAELVSPYDVDAIGKAVCKLMKNGKSQPELSQHILKNYSFDVLSKYLHDTLAAML